MGFGVGDYPWWQYFIMPFMAGVVGWGTNVLALQMTFYPIEFIGIELFRIKNQPWGLFGWQGIIPTKAERIATKAIDLVTSKLLNVKEVFDKLDPIEFSHSMTGGCLLMVDQVINEVATKYMPQVWNELPKDVKDELVVLAFKECPEFLTHMMKDMQENIYDILDLKDMAIKSCVANKHILNTIFFETGGKEIAFIKRSGFYFGFLFGLVQTLIWFFYDDSWVLPFFGFVVGWLTNAIALKIIFRPLNPVKVGPFTFLGLFLKRQKEVSSTYARIVSVEIVNIKAMWNAIFTGPKHGNFEAMLRAHTIVFTEKLVQGIKPLALVALGEETFRRLKEDVAQKVMTKIPDIIDDSYLYMTDKMDLESEIRQKMQNLSTADFESALHPAFEEDELLLIIIGAVLGMMVGIVQLFAMFS